MKRTFLAGILLLAGIAPALAQAPGDKFMCPMTMFPFEDAETEATLQWKILVDCVNEHRLERNHIQSSMPMPLAGSAGTSATPSDVGSSRPTGGAKTGN